MTAGHRRSDGPVRTAVLLLLLLTAFGCASTDPKPTRTAIIQATQEIPTEQLIDVGVHVFDPGLPEPGEEMPEDVFPELRQAEARFMAVQLKKTLERSGQWGAVRVLPAGQGIADLAVSGTILLSTGMNVAVDVRAVDAAGVVWLQERYRANADSVAYLDETTQPQDPFQSMYNQIANDLLEVRRKRSASELISIRQISRMRFAADIAPVPFADYLQKDRKGRTKISKLPSRNDPMMQRVDQVRASEYLFIDTLDQHYATFTDEMDEPYANWRKYTYEEEKAYRELKRKATTQKILGGLAILGAVLADPGSPAAAAVRDAAIIGGMAAIHAGIGTSKEAKIHAEALRELGGSVAMELEPIVIEVEGQTLRLTGTAQTQYEEWRRLLREIWTTETGLPSDLNQPPVGGSGSGSLDRP